MGVNVLLVPLADEHFMAEVIEAVEASGIDYSDLELEITESQIVEYLPLIEQAFQTLNAKGVHIAIDDFGTGYSALAYLTRLHWSTVKIDRAFLAEIPHEANAAWVVSAIIVMAGELGLEVTAERGGDRSAVPVSRRGRLSQRTGLCYARPQPAADFQRLLQLPEKPGWTERND